MATCEICGSEFTPMSQSFPIQTTLTLETVCSMKCWWAKDPRSPDYNLRPGKTLWDHVREDGSDAGQLVDGPLASSMPVSAFRDMLGFLTPLKSGDECPFCHTGFVIVVNGRFLHSPCGFSEPVIWADTKDLDLYPDAKNLYDHLTSDAGRGDG